MIRIATFAILFIAVSGQFQGQSFNGQAFQTTTPAPIHPPAQVHYVNIGQDLAGDYKFGYDTGKGPLGQSFREETRLPDGTVKGAYGYVDASGQQRIVRYTAGKDGFNIDEDKPAGSPATAAAPTPAPQPQRAPAPTFQSFPQAPPTRFAHPPQPAAAPTAAPAFNPALARQSAQPQFQALPQGNAALQFRLQQQAQAQAQAQAAAQQQAAAQAAAQQQAAAQAQAQAQAQAAAQAQAQAQPAANPALSFQSVPQQFRPQPAPQAFQPRPQLTPAQAQLANQLSASNPLSAFPQLPGVRLVQINPRPSAQPESIAPANFASNNLAANSFGASSGSLTTTPAPEEYTGPVVINAALLSYDIGQSRRTN